MRNSVRERALAEAMARHKDRVFRLAVSCLHRHADAEDILQEVFIRYYRSAPEFENEEHEKAWLIRVTVNACISFLRSPWRRLTGPLPESVPAPEAERQWVIELVHKLPTRQAAVIHLHYYEDYSVREIASVLRISEGTVKSRLARGRAKLAEMIEEEEYSDG